MNKEDSLIMGWIIEAVRMLEEVDSYSMPEEWRKDVDSLRIRLDNKVNAN